LQSPKAKGGGTFNCVKRVLFRKPVSKTAHEVKKNRRKQCRGRPEGGWGYWDVIEQGIENYNPDRVHQKSRISGTQRLSPRAVQQEHEKRAINRLPPKDAERN